MLLLIVVLVFVFQAEYVLRVRSPSRGLGDMYKMPVYNLGNRLPSLHEDDFSSLFEDAFDEPLVESFIVKLRYRFGN